MSYTKCSQLFSNYKTEAEMMKCLNEGRQFGCLGIFEDIKFENKSQIKFTPSGKGNRGLKLFFKDMYVHDMFKAIMSLNDLEINFDNYKKPWNLRVNRNSAIGDIVLGLMLGICVYDVIQDSHILTLPSSEHRALMLKLRKAFKEEKLHENSTFEVLLQRIFIKKYDTLIDAFDGTKKICEDFIFYMNGDENFKKNYSIAYNNILTGTFFHANCDFLLDLKHLPDDEMISMNPIVRNAEEPYLHWTEESKPILSPQKKGNTGAGTSGNGIGPQQQLFQTPKKHRKTHRSHSDTDVNYNQTDLKKIADKFKAKKNKNQPIENSIKQFFLNISKDKLGNKLDHYLNAKDINVIPLEAYEWLFPIPHTQEIQNIKNSSEYPNIEDNMIIITFKILYFYGFIYIKDKDNFEWRFFWLIEDGKKKFKQELPMILRIIDCCYVWDHPQIPDTLIKCLTAITDQQIKGNPHYQEMIQLFMKIQSSFQKQDQT